jgi:hypothetical protein
MHGEGGTRSGNWLSFIVQVLRFMMKNNTWHMTIFDFKQKRWKDFQIFPLK